MIEKSLQSEIKSSSIEGARAPATVLESGDAVRHLPMEDGTRLFETVIAGVPLRLKSSHDELTVNELVGLVDRKVREALSLTKSGSIQNAAILAALHLAEEYLLLKRRAKVELDELEAKARKVISELESSRVMTGLNN